MIDTATGCLFDAPSNELSLTEVLSRKKPIDKAQRRFQKLVTQIERLRERLTQWENYTHRYNQRVTGELHPLQEQLRAARKQMAQLIDELLSAPMRGRRLGKVQRSKLTHILTQLVEDLLQEADDDALRALQDKHRTPVNEDDQLLPTEVTREILREVTGLDIVSSGDARTPEELMEHVRRLMEEPNDDSPRSDTHHRRRDREAHTEVLADPARATRESPGRAGTLRTTISTFCITGFGVRARRICSLHRNAPKCARLQHWPYECRGERRARTLLERLGIATH